MRINRVAVSVLFIGAVQAGAQDADAAAHGKTTVTSPVAALSFDGPDTSKPMVRCWMGCTGSLSRVALSEWQSPQAWRDLRELEARRKQNPLAFRDASGRPASAGTSSTSLPVAPGAPSGQNRSTISAADARRYSIEEWRRVELAVDDSVHHAVLVRLARTFDSAQATSPEERPRILAQIDGLNHVNQLMWLERAWEVNRQADSALRAMTASP